MPTWRRLLQQDPLRQMRVWLEVEEDGTFLFRHEHYGIMDVVEYNKEYVKHNPKNVHAGNTQKHAVKVGEIPLTVWMQLKDEGIARDKQALRKWLNDPDNRYFRTYGGTI